MYLIIARNKLGHSMENTIAREFSGPTHLLKHMVQCRLHLPFSFLLVVSLLVLHLIPDLSRDCPVMDWYLGILAFLLIDSPMLPSMLAARGVAPFQESLLLSFSCDEVFVLPISVSKCCFFSYALLADTHLHTVHHRAMMVSYMSPFFLNFTVTRSEKISSRSFVDSAFIIVLVGMLLRCLSFRPPS